MTGAAGTGSEVRLEGRISLFGQDEDLVASAREIWEIIAPEVESVARQFWVQYSRSGEPGREIGPAKLEELTRRIAPYIEAKYSRLDNPSWVETARHYVGAAASAGVSLTTLFSGISAGAGDCGLVQRDLERPGGLLGSGPFFPQRPVRHDGGRFGPLAP